MTSASEMPIEELAALIQQERSEGSSGERYITTVERYREVMNAYAHIDNRHRERADWIADSCALKFELDEAGYEAWLMKSEEWEDGRHNPDLRIQWETIQSDGSRTGRSIIYDYRKRANGLSPALAPGWDAMVERTEAQLGLPSEVAEAEAIGRDIVSRVAAEEGPRIEAAREVARTAIEFLRDKSWYDRRTWTLDIAERMNGIGLSDPASWLSEQCMADRNALIVASVIRVGDGAYAIRGLPTSRVRPRATAEELQAVFAGSPRVPGATVACKPENFLKYLHERKHLIESVSQSKCMFGVWEQTHNDYLNRWIYEELPVAQLIRRKLLEGYDVGHAALFCQQLEGIAGGDWRLMRDGLSHAMRGHWGGSERLAWGFILASQEQGIGKTNLQAILSRIVGAVPGNDGDGISYSQQIEDTNRFTSGNLADAALIKLSELKLRMSDLRDGIGVEEIFKQFLPGAQDDLRVSEQKFMQPRMTHFSDPIVIATTNHPERLNVKGGRRVSLFGPDGEATQEQLAVAKEVFDLLKGSEADDFCASVGAYLIGARTGSGFSAIRAPETTHRLTARREGASPLMARILGLAHQEDGPFLSPSGPVLLRRIMECVPDKTAENAVRAILRELGLSNYQVRYWDNGKTQAVNIWASKAALGQYRGVEIFMADKGVGQRVMSLRGLGVQELVDKASKAGIANITLPLP